MEVVLLADKALPINNVASKNNIPEIVKKYGSRLHAFIRKRVQTVEDADDILQDVYFQLIESERLLKPIDQMLAWLYTVARNRIIDLYRKKRPEPLPFLADDDDLSPIDELGDFMFDNGSTPETEYLRSLVWTELNEALTELPPEQQNVFELTEIKGLSFKEISEKTGVSINTLISRKHYAVLYLRERLQILYEELLNF